MQVPLLVDDFLARAAQLYPSKVAIVDADLARVTAFASSVRIRTFFSKAFTQPARSASSSYR